MIRHALLLFGLVMLLTLTVSSTHASTINCSGGIVSIGDERIDLLSKCGQPDWKDSHQEEVTERFDPVTKKRTYITVDEWTYDFGPQQFMRIVIIKNGRIADVRTGGYGTDRRSKPDKLDCRDSILSAGDSKAEVLTKSGEPASKECHQEDVRERITTDQWRTISITVEEWTYNFGPERFLRILTFKNGIVSDVRTGGYGYSEKRDDKPGSH